MAEPYERREAAIQERLETPEASAVEKVLAIVEGVAEGFAEQSRAGRLPQAAGAAVDKAAETVQEVARGVQAGPAMPPSAPGGEVEARMGATERLAESVRDTAGRAREATAAIAHDTRQAARRVGRDLRRAAGSGAAAIAFGLTAFILLSLTLAAVIDLFLGRPWGLLLVGLLYALAAWILVSVARRAAREAGQDTREGAQAIRRELRRIPGGRPQT